MPLQSRYVFSAAMDVEPSREAIFNEVYDTEHVPILLGVPGVLSVARVKVRPLTMVLGGEKKTIVFENEPRYNAFYEIASPEVLTSEAWGRAVDGFAPDRFDVIGACLCLAGVAVIMYAPR